MYIPWKVSAVVGVDDKVLLSVEETVCDRDRIMTLLFQQAQEISEHHHS